MTVRVDEIAAGIFRLSTFVPEVTPLGMTFNQYLITAEDPLLFHCGPRGMFDSVSKAAASIVPLSRLRWITFGHVESDECGSMNQWLAAAPRAQIAHGATACMVSLNDLADRPPRVLANGEVVDLGGKRVRYLDTPHVPHAWESGIIFEETTATLFTGDLFAHLGDGPAITDASIVPAAIQAEEAFKASALTPETGSIIRALAALAPRRLAVMHGTCYAGDGARALEELARFYDAAHASAARK
jgi:flavorubredoxin